MAAVPSPAMGTAFLSAGGEAPLEQDPASKHCLEERAHLPESILWQLQGCYYEALGESAWSKDVPSFASANAKLAQDYARMIFHFLRDVYTPTNRAADAPEPPTGPCLVFEIGAGHGRFTRLLLRFLLTFQPFFEPLGLPARPFVLYFTDFAGPNVEACRNHPDLKPYVDDGWLNFMVFDANEPPELAEFRALAKDEGWRSSAPAAEVPTIVICNYVLDTLAQEALQLGDDPPTVRRGLLSIFSPHEEPTFLDHSLSSRLTFAWDWENSDELLAAALSANEKGEGEAATPSGKPIPLKKEVSYDEGFLAVLRAYLARGGAMTVVVPIGGFQLIRSLQKLAGGRLLLLVGDKGHQDFTEFTGWRDPHLAVHGSFSFMVNFDALRIFFEHSGGFAAHTPYYDLFQCGVYGLGARSAYPSLLSALADARYDFGPGSMMSWSRQLAMDADILLHPHTAQHQEPALPLVKCVMALLRYSSHDPELFWQFQQLILHQCSLAHLGSRGAKDLAADLDLIYRNSFRMSGVDNRDLAVAIGECLVRMGRVAQAAEYFQRSLEERGPRVSVLLQWSCCLQASGRIDEAIRAVEEAQCLDPSSVAAAAQMRNLEMYANSLGTVLIGGGRLTIEQSGPLLVQDLRFRVKAVFGFGEEEARAMAAALERVNQVLRITGQDVASEGSAGVEGGSLWRPEVVWGSEGLQEILKRSDIAVCVVDVHHKLLSGLLPKLWTAQKHVLTHSPLAYDLESARSLLAAYEALPAEPSRPAWHALESARFEDALQLAAESLSRVGSPQCVSMVIMSPPGSVHTRAASSVPTEEQMAIDIVHGLVAATRVTQTRLAAISCQTSGNTARASAGSPPRQDMALAGHFLLSPTADTSAAASTGTFVICRSGAEARWELRFHCARGSLVLKREKAAWQMTVTDDRAGAFGRKTLERSLPCVGYRSSHQAFLAQVRACCSGERQRVDVSVEHALMDTAILGSLLSSMRSNGASMAFKYAS